MKYLDLEDFDLHYDSNVPVNLTQNAKLVYMTLINFSDQKIPLPEFNAALGLNFEELIKCLVEIIWVLQSISDYHTEQLGGRDGE